MTTRIMRATGAMLLLVGICLTPSYAAVDPAARGLAVQAKLIAITGIGANLRLIRQQMMSSGQYRYTPFPIRTTDVPTITSVNTGVAATTTVTAGGSAYQWQTPQFAWNSGKISYIGATPVAYSGSNGTGGLDSHVYYGAAEGHIGNRHRERFMTGAPEIYLHFMTTLGGGTPDFAVDGQVIDASAQTFWVSKASTTGRNFVKLSFGAIPATQELQSAVVAAGGSGCVEGEILTATGGTGSAATFRVTGVSSGGVTAFQYVSRGTYSARPTGTLATTASASCAGATFTATWRLPPWEKMRTIDIYDPASNVLTGVSVGPGYDVLAVPANGPVWVFAGDSWEEGSYAATQYGTWWQQAARRLGIDNAYSVAAGGTGVVATNNGSRTTYGGRIPDIIALAPADPLTPLVVVTSGSENDNTATNADITANTAAYFTQLRAGLAAVAPTAILIATDPWTSSANITPQTKVDAWRAGVAAANAAGANILSIQNYGWLNVAAGVSSDPTSTAFGTRNGSYLISSRDLAHPDGQGHDYIGFMMAEALRQLLSGPI